MIRVSLKLKPIRELIRIQCYRNFSGSSAAPAYKRPNSPRLGAFLARYGTDLTESMKNQQWNPMVGREEEINRVIQILSRKTKNNPCLIGDSGVGKTSIVEGLAYRIHKGNCPTAFKDKVIIALDLPSMLAGAKFRGEFEDRLKGVLKDIEMSNGRIIIFIDEMHVISGAGGSDGAIDAGNILKPYLSKGLVRCLGTTTQEEYRTHILKDSALARRFQTVDVCEPDIPYACDILRGLKESYERYHHVEIPDETVEAAVKLSSKYITERKLPDKAIDLLDEAAAKLNLSSPSAYDDVKSLVTESASDAVPSESTGSVQEEEQQLPKPALTPTHIAQVLSQSTGIPVGNMLDDELHRLRSMESVLRAEIVDQNHAIELVSRCLKRSRANLRFHDRPLGVFMLLGPTGVGKTALCKALTKFLFNDPHAMLRVDMSEYMERISVSKLIGAPPGYVGYDQGGVLTESIRKKPYQVILLDEFEKAHVDVSNVLLQLFDEGRLSDANGAVVDFRNTIVILTSNLGSQKLANSLNSDGMVFTHKQRQELGQEIVRTRFPPEFVNRLDEVVVFDPLSYDTIKSICGIQLKRIVDLLKESHSIELHLDSSVTTALAQRSYEESREYGARPLKRLIQREIMDPLASCIIEDQISERDALHIFALTAEYMDTALLFEDLELICSHPLSLHKHTARNDGTSGHSHINDTANAESEADDTKVPEDTDNTAHTITMAFYKQVRVA